MSRLTIDDFIKLEKEQLKMIKSHDEKFQLNPDWVRHDYSLTVLETLKIEMKKK